jgi:hypothetical protein
MRKVYLASILMLGWITGSLAQVTTNSGSGLAATYPDLASAVTALNAATISSPVVITLTGNETAPAGGYSITAQGTAANTIIIEGSSSTITASAALVAGSLNDAIFKLVGADYVTLRNFTMVENGANTTTAAATNNMTEWGVALLYATTTNGAQNCTLSNNNISLNRTYQNSFGIYSNSTHAAATVGTTATATTGAGNNSGLKIYGNTISNVNNGIVVVGPTAAADYNTGVDIGGSSAATGNTINNYGNTGTFSTFANVSGTLYGVLIRNSTGFNVSYNTITNAATGNTAGTLRGIYNVSASATPTGTFTNNINNNTISLTYGVATGTMQGITVESTNATTTSAINLNNNDFSGFASAIASSVAITCVSMAAPHFTVNINGNTFSNITTNTTGSFTFISNNVTRPANATATANNNSIVTGFNKTGAGGTVQFYISNSTSPTTVTETNTGNDFSNVTVTGATTVAGWTSTDGSTTSPFGPAKTVTNNTFTNITGGTSGVTALSVAYSNNNSAATNIVSGNMVNTITGGGAVTGIASVSGGQTFINNTVFGLSSTGAAAVSGISITGGGTQTVSKSKVYDLSGSNASATVNGILVSAGTLVTLNNNLVGDLRTPAANAANPLNGINITGGTTVNANFNTVLLDASSTGALFGSSAVSVSTSPTVTLRNNIFVNNSTVSGAAFAAAHRRSSTTLTTYAAASNNNLFYAGSPSATNVIFYDGTNNDQTLAAYKSRVAARDGASITENPDFLNVSGAAPDFLHINPGTATQLESAAVPVAGITDDFDGDTRNATTPDIGADEFTGTPADFTGPAIGYTALGSTACLSNSTLGGVTITDASGVNITAGTRPRMYFKKQTNANAFNDNTNATDGWKFVEASGAGGSPFSFTTDYSLLFGGAGVAVGDTIQYFIVAQDLASTPNLSINIGTFAAAPSSVALTAAAFPIGGTPNKFGISVSLSGTVTVGAGGTYPTLTGTGGLFEAINANGMTGAITANIISASITEPGTVALNAINYNGCTAGPFPLLIKPDVGVTSTLTGAVGTGAIIKLNGADNVTIDGSNSGGSSRDLTIQNTTATTSGNAVVWLASPATGNGANNNTVKNCIIEGNSATTTFLGMYIGGSTTISLAAAGLERNNNNTVTNNLFRKTQHGLGLFGFAAATPDQNNLINNNNFGTATAGEGFALTGINADRQENLVVSGNEIRNITNATTASNVFGIRLLDFKNGQAFNNKIHSMSYTGASTPKYYGIALTSSSYTTVGNPSNALVYNNSVSNITSTGTSAVWNTTGILAGAGYGDRYYHNSVHLSGQLASSSSGLAAAFANGDGNITAVGTNIDVRNNIFSITGSNGVAGGNFWAYYTPATTLAGSTLNYNDLYCNGTNVTNNIGRFNAVNHTTLAAWQTATGQEANTINVEPVFVSTTDLHLVPASNFLLDNFGTPIAAVTTDIDNAARSATAPDMGVDEFAAPTVTDAGVTAIVLPTSVCSGSTPVSATVRNLGTVAITSILIDWTVTPGGAQTQVNPGAINLAPGASQTFLLGNFNFVPGTVYSITATTSSPNGGADGVPGNDAFTQNNVQTGLSGTYTVGAGGNYATLTAAVADYNTRSLCGPVVFSLTDANYSTSETFPININANASASVTNTLTIKPATGISPLVTGAVGTGALIKLNGADYVTIDGSNNGSNSRDLTIQNTTATTTGNAVVWLASPATGNGATNNTVKNCVIEGNSATTTFLGMYIGGGTTISLAAAGLERNNNNTVTNNLFRKTQHGLGLFGFAAATPDQNNLINNNNFGTATAGEGFALTGINADRQENLVVSGNEVRNITNATTASNVFGIRLLDFKNGQAFNNKVHSMSYTGTSTPKYYGIAVTSSSYTTVGNPSNGLFYNNSVSNITSTGTSAVWNTTGILAGAGYGDRFYHNSVHLSGQLASSSSGLAAAFANGDGNITAVGTNIDVRNNIFSITGSSSIAGGNFWAYYTPATSLTGSILNYNDLYCNGTNVTNNIGRFNAVNHTTLAAWQAATGQEANSINVAPVFASNTDLHLDVGSNAGLDNLGTPIAAVTTDIDNAARSATAPDMGVDEFTPVACAEAVGGSAAGSAFGCLSYTGTITASGYSTGTGSTYQWVSAPSPSGPWTAIGGATTPSAYTISPAITATTYYKLAVGCSNGPTVDSSSVVTITIAAKPTVPVTPGGPVTICAPNSLTLDASGTNAATPGFVWLRNNTVISGATGATYAASTAGSYRVRITDGVTGCFDTSAVVVLNVNPQPVNPVATATPDTVCIGGTVNLTASAGIGYTMNPAGTETFIDIDAATSATSIASLLDDSEHNISMPAFKFNGITYKTARIGMNGAVALGATTGDITTANAALPSTANTAGNLLLMPWWDDLDLASSGPASTIKLDTVGSKFIIQWTNTAHNDFLTGTVKFQIQLDTASGLIHYVYNDVVFGNATQDNGASATVGIQWSSAEAVQFSFNTASLTAPQCITFTPVVPGYAWTGPNGFTSTLPNPTLTNVSSLDSGTYQVVFTNLATGCIDTATVTVHVRPATTSEWIGAVNTDWNTAGNWVCGAVPTTTSNVIIRSGVPNYPVIAQNVEIRSLTVRAGATFTVNTGFDLKLNGN